MADVNMNSILISTRLMSTGDAESTDFDSTLILHINTALFLLNQLGIGPEIGYSITGVNELWTDFIGDRKDIESVKTYVYLNVRLIFDPPSTSFVLESIQKQIAQLEWRLVNQAEKPTGGEVIVSG